MLLASMNLIYDVILYSFFFSILMYWLYSYEYHELASHLK